MKKIKRLLASLMVVAMLLTTAPLSGFVGLELPDIFDIFASAETYSGTCGDNLTWTFDTEIGELTIDGTGAMYDYDYDNRPWESYKVDIGSVVIGNGVTKIGALAFCYCQSLAIVTIPDSVTTIGDYAFDDCYNLENIIIPDGVTTIGNGAFYYCTSLTSITIPDSVTTIGNSVFYYCTSLTSVTIPDSVTTIEYDSFRNCTNLTSITIPDSVTTIGAYAFDNCTSLTSITIPDSVTTIGDKAFRYCTSLTSVTIGNSVTTIGAYAFEDCTSLTSVTIGNSVTTIGAYAFEDCNSLISIEVDADNEYYSSDSYGVLYNKNKTKLIRYPIGNERTEFTIPDSVTTIGTSAFSDCNSLASITIPESVTTIEEYAFRDYHSLISIEVDADNEYYSSDSYGVLYNKNKTKLIRYPIGNERTEFTIPDSVTTIGDSAFSDCQSLTSVTIPDSVTTIGYGAFSGCNSLTSVTIPDSVTTIGDGAFLGCNSLTSVTIPDNVTTIKGSAFGNCTSLTSVTIPDSVTTIGGSAFYYDYSLTDVYYSGTYEEWQKISIGTGNECLTNATIHYDSSAVATKNLDYYIDDDDAHKKLSMQVTLKDEWFAEDSAEYNHELGGFCSQFTVLGYTKASHPLTDEQKENGTRPAGYITKNQVLRNALTKMGFSDPEVNLSAPREGVNHFVTNKKITVNSEEHTLIFIGLIGSYMEQWYSNFDPGTGSTHMGFNGAKNYVSEIVGEYIKNHNLDKSKTKVLITGHSRGAATSNLLAKEFISGSLSRYTNPSNVYTYAFATPNSTSLPERNDEIYKRIFNIVNPEDFVTKVLPTAWKFGNYGTTYTLPSRTNTKPSEYKVHLNKMQTYFKQLKSGEAYAPYRDGEVTVYNLVEKFTSTVKSLNDFNNKEMRFAALTYIKPWDFFQIAICPLVGEEVGSSGFISGIANFALCLADIGAAKTYREFAKFFLENAVLDKVNKMAPDAAHVVLQALSSSTGLSPEALLASSEGYFEDSHCAETYCAYMMTLSKAELVKEKEALLHTVNCPVDVEVIDKATGDVVGRIVNNIIDEEISAKDNAIVMTVDGDSKSFWLPSDGDYEVKLTGNDEGTMDYSVSEVDSVIGETQRINFFDVEITDGKEMTGEINSEDFVLEEYTLSFEDESIEDMLPTEIMSGDEIVNYNIDINVEGYGNATESMTVASGDYVSLVATPVEGNEFLGWYEGSELISTDVQYSFVAKSDRILTAKFKAIIGDVNSDCKINSTDALLCLQHSVEKIKLEGDTFTAADVDKNGFVNSSDALKILQFSVGKIDKL